MHAAAVAEDEANAWGLRDGLFLIRADNAQADAAIETDSHGRAVGHNIEAADWTIVPLLRPASTDLNFTLAFALVAMVVVMLASSTWASTTWISSSPSWRITGSTR